MEAAHRSSASSHNLFEVYLRLRPPPSNGTATERILTVETREGEHDEQGDDINLGTSHIVLNPPTDRRRAIEKFAFTRVFEEDASQLDVFHRADILPMVEGVLAPNGGEGTDAMVATLGVTGSGKVSFLFLSAGIWDEPKANLVCRLTPSWVPRPREASPSSLSM